MATLYLDFLNGNDANDGSSFANRFQTFTSGATAARTAPGDTIRLMKSEDPVRVIAAAKSITSSTNASPISVEVTGHGYSTGDQVVISGHTTNTSANGTWTITVVDANNFTLNSSTGNGVGGATGIVRRLVTATFTDLSPTVTLSEAVTKTIETCETPWTPNTNVTATTPATRKEGSLCSQLQVASGFTTGRIAHKSLGAATDFSSYSKITFWVRTGIPVASGVLQIKLCSDTGGLTAVNTITINEALNSGTLWRPIVIDNGGALGSSIQSVALYAVSDPGSVTLALDNIEACNEFSLVSLISTQSGATSLDYWPVQSINGTTVKVDASANFTLDVGTNVGYVGTGGTSVAIYKRDPVRVTTTQTVQEAGSSGNMITYSGGWDTTAMTTQDGVTFVDFADGSLIGVSSSRASLVFEKIAVVRSRFGWELTSDTYTLTDCAAIATGHNTTTSYGFRLSAAGITATLTRCVALCGFCNSATITGISAFALTVDCVVKSYQSNSGQTRGLDSLSHGLTHTNVTVEGMKGIGSGYQYGVIFSGSISTLVAATIRSITGTNTGLCFGLYLSTDSNSVTDISVSNISSASGAAVAAAGVYISGINNTLRNITTASITNSSSGGGYGIANPSTSTYARLQNFITGLITSGAVTASIYASNSAHLVVDDVSLSESTKVVTDIGTSTRVVITRYEGDPADYRIYERNTTVAKTETTIVDTGSVQSIKHSPQTAHSASFPFIQKTMPMVVNSSGTLTITIRVRRSTTNVAAQLYLRGGQVDGIATDQTVDASASANTWETLTLTCSPTQKVPIELELRSWQVSGSGDVYWDTATNTQA